MRSILVTRPEPAGSELAGRLRREGFETHSAPLSRYVPIPADLGILPSCQALVFTSAQGVAQFPPQTARDTTVFAVGTATAEAAQNAGFAHVITGGGDVRDLAQILIARKEELGLSAVLHISGEDTAEDLTQLLADSGITAHKAVVYRTEFIEKLPADVEAALLAGKIDTVLLFSARAAQHWLKLLSTEALRSASAALEAICLSERVAIELRGTPWRAIKVAKNPQVDSVLDILRGADTATSLPLTLPADPVIDIFGGIRPLANRLGITASTVQGWKKRGIIPDTRVEAIYAAAAEDDIDLNAQLAKGQYKMTMDDVDGRLAGSSGSERRRSSDRRQQRPTYDAHGNVRSATYSGPDRRTGIDRRAHQARQQQRIRAEKMRFITRTVLMAAFFIGALVYAGFFLMAPEFFSFTERHDREKAYEQQLQEYEDKIRELERQQNELRRRQGAAPLPQSPQQTASPGIGQRMNQGIMKVQGAVDTVKSTVSGTIEGAQKTVQKNETYQGFQSLMRMMAVFNNMTRSKDGAAEADGMMGNLRSIMAGAPDDPEGLSRAVEQAQKTDPALQKVMEGIAPKDLGAAAMLLTMNELRGNMGGGQSFESDLKIIEKYAKDDPEMQAALKRVAPYARSGVLSRSHLQKEFRNIAADIVMAKLQGEDASVRERVLLRLSKYAKMRKVDDIEGDTVDATVARAELLLDQGDIKSAIRELQSLEGAPAETAAPWLQQAEGHVAADDSSQVLMQTVLGMLGNGGGSVLGGGFGGGGINNLNDLNAAVGELLQQLPGGAELGVPGMGQPTVPYLSPSLQQNNSNPFDIPLP
ncbi:MAG: uroporphyrinogen-III synthase [Bdellovibrionales bacterium]|jgi:uroporphyrinogen-III synthase|nr:uroporphyrinogen-III synthase [Bdellovibrionales bacterium]